MPTIDNFLQHIYVFAAILGVLLLAFLIFFVMPYAKVWWRLDRVTKKLSAVNGKSIDDFDLAFDATGVLQTLLREYSDTLHKQTEVDSRTGHQRIVRGRDCTSGTTHRLEKDQ